MDDLPNMFSSLGTSDNRKFKQFMAGIQALVKDKEKPGGEISPIEREFINAVNDGDVRHVTEALTKDKELVHRNIRGMIPLNLAAHRGHLPIVELLIKSGATVDVKDADGDTALSTAVVQDESQIVEYLLDHGADTHKADKRFGMNPLHIATSMNHIQCVKMLLSKVSNPNLKNKLGDTALNIAVEMSRNSCLDLLINVRNIDLNLKNKMGHNSIFSAVFVNNVHATRILIQKQRSLVDTRIDNGCTPLHIAVIGCRRYIAEILITEGKCTIDPVNNKGHTPLNIAICQGRTLFIEDLVKHGASVNATDDDGDSCLHNAVLKFRQGQDVEDSENLQKFRKRYGDNGITKPITALMCFLVQEGANINQTNLARRTPFDLLKDVSIIKVLKQIAQKSSTLKREDTDQNTRDHGNDDASRETDVPTSDNGGSLDRHERNDIQDSSRSLLPDDSFTGFHVIKDPEKEVTLISEIGGGGFGVVWKGKWNHTPVAVKVLPTEGSKDDKVEKEVEVHKRVVHPNIVKILAVGHQPAKSETLIVMQLIEGSNLLDIIRDGNPYSFQQKVKLCKDLLSAVTYLHLTNILHLDIKPQNVMVEEKTKKPYLCDLGLGHIKTRCMSEASKVSFGGTRLYMPPEASPSESGNMSATSAYDVWSVACTFVELFTGESVWPKTITPMALMFKFLSDDVMPASVNNLEKDIKKILEPCFQKTPAARPSAESMMQQFSAVVKV